MGPIRTLMAVVMLATLAACDRPGAAPVEPSPAGLSEQWRSVRLPTAEHCGDVGCLVGLSGVNRPTVVSVRLLPVSVLKKDKRCWMMVFPPGLDSLTASNEAWLRELLTSGAPRECPAFADAAQFTPWQRSDRHYSFEAQNGFAYAFIPAGYIDRIDQRRIRCAIFYDPRALAFNIPDATLRQAAEVCAVLFHFREDS